MLLIDFHDFPVAEYKGVNNVESKSQLGILVFMKPVLVTHGMIWRRKYPTKISLVNASLFSAYVTLSATQIISVMLCMGLIWHSFSLRLNYCESIYLGLLLR